MHIIKRSFVLTILGVIISCTSFDILFAQTKYSALMDLSVKLNNEYKTRPYILNKNNKINLNNYNTIYKKNQIDFYLKKYPPNQVNHKNDFDKSFTQKYALPRILAQSDLGALQTTQTDAIKTNGSSLFNIEANGWNIGLWDAGNPLLTHQEFGVRIQLSDTNQSITTNYHATSVAGSAIAHGTNAEAIGAASEAIIQSYDWNNDQSEMAHAAANDLKLSIHPYVESTGWYYNWFNDNRWMWYADSSISTIENAAFGYYNEQSKNWDEIAYLAPNYLIVKAAGNFRGLGPETQPVAHWIPFYNNVNEAWEWKLSSTIRDINGGDSGFETISHSSLAKNILTIGNTFKLNGAYTQASDITIGTNSSYGPTDDGRIKPDISVPGQDLILATSSSNTGYTTSSGTSFASGVAAGIIADLQSFYTKLFTSNPSSSMIKSLLIQTADEAGEFEGPDYKFGWGLMNAERAARLLYNYSISNPLVFLADTSISNGQTIEFEFKPYFYSEVKATICWTDPAGTPPPNVLNPSNSVLINDLDIRIYDENLNEYLPWKLDRANPASAATKADNSIDNVEQIFLNNSSGALTVRISHKGTLSSLQKLSLIISAEEPSSSRTISGDKGWRLLSFPEEVTISQASQQSFIQGINGLDFGTNYNSNIYTGFSNNNWTKPTINSEVIEKGYGFIQYFYNNNFTSNSQLPIQQFSGAKESTQSVTINLEQAGSKFTMAGNPFARPIRFDELISLNGDIADTGWIWNTDNGWVSISQLAQDLINPHEGFFIETIDATQVEIPYSSRRLNNENFKSTVSEDLKLTVSLKNGISYNAMDNGIKIKYLSENFDNPRKHLIQKPSPLHYNFSKLNLHLTEPISENGEINDFYQIPIQFKNHNITQLYLSLKTTQAGIYTIQTELPSMLNESLSVTIEDHNETSQQSLISLNDNKTFTIEITDANRKSDNLYQSQTFKLTIEKIQLTSLGEESKLKPIHSFFTSKVAPNPFNPSTSLQLNVLEANHFLIQLYSITGKLIKTIADTNFKSGNFSFSINGNNLSSGVYFIKITSNNKLHVEKITLIK